MRVKNSVLVLVLLFSILLLEGKQAEAIELIPRASINLPGANSYVEDTVTVSGWALDPSGIKTVEVYIDDKLMGVAEYGIPRADVSRIFPGYPDSTNSGFRYSLDTTRVSSGEHILSILAKGNDGTRKTVSRKIISANPVPRSSINFPYNNSQVSKTIKVYGWALNYSGISKVDVYLNSRLVGQATYGLLREDVARAFPVYPNASNSGFSYSLDTTLVPSGNYVLTIEAIGNNGEKHIVRRNITINNLPPKATIDLPANESEVKGLTNVSGWALNVSGIRKVEIYVDEKLIDVATYGIIRENVAKVFPAYPNALNSGYRYVLNTYTLSEGQHRLKVKAIGNNGEEKSLGRTIYVKHPEPIMNLARIKNNDVATRDLQISGWALNGSKVQKVVIFIDGKWYGQATYGLTREDVAKVYPYYPGAEQSGYSYLLDTTRIKNGTHSIEVVAVGYDGTRVSAERSLIFANTTTYYTSYSKTLDEMVNIQYNLGPVTDSSGRWEPATETQIKYYVNPANFMDEYGKYQFLRLNFAYGITAEDLNRVLEGKGVLSGKGEVFLRAARENDINPAYLVSHALLETGNGTSALARGVLVTTIDGVAVTPKVAYNMFGIGALDQDPLKLGRGPTALGAERAYKEGWFSVDAAILGGAKFISTRYVNHSTYKQNTLYKMRWNPAIPGTHQYATDIGWAYKQIRNIKAILDQLTDAVLIFDIPRYKST